MKFCMTSDNQKYLYFNKIKYNYSVKCSKKSMNVQLNEAYES